MTAEIQSAEDQALVLGVQRPQPGGRVVHHRVALDEGARSAGPGQAQPFGLQSLGLLPQRLGPGVDPIDVVLLRGDLRLAGALQRCLGCGILRYSGLTGGHQFPSQHATCRRARVRPLSASKYHHAGYRGCDRWRRYLTSVFARPRRYFP
jgi:hypothetical protein